MVGGLTATPVDRVPEVVAAPDRMTLGRSLGRTVAPISHGGAPIINGFPGVLNLARTSLGKPIGPRWFPIMFGTLQPRPHWLGASLLSQQCLNLLLGLTLALEELG